MSQQQEHTTKPIFIPAAEPLPASPSDGTDIPSQVMLFNDDYHTFADVILQLMKAIGCTSEVGYIFAYEVHTKGKANVFNGPLVRCLQVADILREINLKVEVQSLI